ncbi:HAD family hydrolase [Bacillus massiliglaciei]|uniref:HAD family hydrolase n=1 Tax=Bacillus massiliglaciei TaxID=1816693 RepID=UPI0018FE8493|nr:HAD-IA family hydrolase [Bacillus massiliglaciei]
MSKNDPIIFDLDGTIFDCKELTNLTFPRTLEVLKERYSEELEMKIFPSYEHFLGMVTDDIFAILLPNADSEVIEEAEAILVDIEAEYIPKAGKLFPHVEDTLKALKNEGYPLYIASNGSKEYVHRVIEEFSLESYFVDLYSAGGQETRTKVELVAKLLDAYPAKKGVMVGDRHSDIEAGKFNQLITIGCRYGFGDEKEIQDADYTVHHIQEILPIIKKQSEKDPV